MRFVLLALGTLVLAVSPAPSADQASPAVAPAAVSQDGLTVGVDTIDTVTAKLGKPFYTARGSDGQTVMTYMSQKTHVKGSTFIPIVGAFAGGAKSHVSTKTFIFSADGKLSSFTSSDTNADCHTGLAGVSCG